MKSYLILLGAMLGVVIGSSVAEADGLSHAPPSWTGFYIGANIGYAWSDAKWKVLADQTAWVDLPPGGAGSDLTNHSVDGWIGGGHLGYIHKLDSYVLGAELSLMGGDIEGTSASKFQAQDDKLKTQIDYILLGTVRLGHTWGQWLPYVKGGYASARVNASIVDNNGLPFATGAWSSSNTYNGWTVGAGVEYALIQNISIGLEYNHISLGNKDFSAFSTDGFGEAQLWGGNIKLDPIDHFSLRMSYHF